VLLVSRSFGLFDRVRITTDKFVAVGVAEGAAGYIIGTSGDESFEVEVSGTGADRAVVHIIAMPEELRRADPGA
jgi:hypothetical protein